LAALAYNPDLLDDYPQEMILASRHDVSRQAIHAAINRGVVFVDDDTGLVDMEAPDTASGRGTRSP